MVARFMDLNYLFCRKKYGLPFCSWVQSIICQFFVFFCHIFRTMVCWDPDIFLPWQRYVTSSSFYRPSLQLVSHVVRNRPCWKARIALGKDKQKNTKRSRTSFKVVLEFLCLPCPVLFLCPMAFLGILARKGPLDFFMSCMITKQALFALNFSYCHRYSDTCVN